VQAIRKRRVCIDSGLRDHKSFTVTMDHHQDQAPSNNGPLQNSDDVKIRNESATKIQSLARGFLHRVDFMLHVIFKSGSCKVFPGRILVLEDMKRWPSGLSALTIMSSDFSDRSLLTWVNDSEERPGFHSDRDESSLPIRRPNRMPSKESHFSPARESNAETEYKEEKLPPRRPVRLASKDSTADDLDLRLSRTAVDAAFAQISSNTSPLILTKKLSSSKIGNMISFSPLPFRRGRRVRRQTSSISARMGDRPMNKPKRQISSDLSVTLEI
jgi:hypothetical protein